MSASRQATAVALVRRGAPEGPLLFRLPWRPLVSAVPGELQSDPRKPFGDPREASRDRLGREEWAQPAEGEENLWKRDDVPHEGWVCVDVIDLGEPAGICRMCGHQIIRYVHVMRHPDYPRTIGAGCVCAGRMEGNPEAAADREAAFKNRLARRETFVQSKTKRSRKGNEYLKYKGELVTLLPDRFRPGCWKTALRGIYTDPRPTREEALADAFDILDPWTLGQEER